MHSTTRQPRSRFIDDLIPLILESSSHWWPRDLLRLAHVSRAWLGFARRRLYALPNIHSFRACSQLARTLRGNPTLLLLVKGVELRPTLGENIAAKDRANLNYILSIEGLHHITLGGLLAVKAERFLHSIGDAQSVIYLHIDGRLLSESLNFRPSLEWDETIALQFNNLHKLRLTEIELDISYPSIPYELQLSELHLDNVTVMSGYLSHFLHETPSLPRLCVRYKGASELGEQVKLVLDSYSIHTLELEIDGTHNSIFHNDPPSLPSLCCLRLTGVQADSGILAVISQNCRNLEELMITGRMVTILPCEWISFINNRHLPRLRSLGVPWGTRELKFTWWCGSTRDAVVKVAALHNIHLCPEYGKN